MDSKHHGKFTKQCGTSFMHHSWNVISDESIGIRRNVPQKTLETLDKVYKHWQYSTTVSYCKGCVQYVNNSCTECEKTKSHGTSTKEVQTEQIMCKTCTEADTVLTASEHIDVKGM